MARMFLLAMLTMEASAMSVADEKVMGFNPGKLENLRNFCSYLEAATNDNTSPDKYPLCDAFNQYKKLHGTDQPLCPLLRDYYYTYVGLVQPPAPWESYDKRCTQSDAFCLIAHADPDSCAALEHVPRCTMWMRQAKEGNLAKCKADVKVDTITIDSPYKKWYPWANPFGDLWSSVAGGQQQTDTGKTPGFCDAMEMFAKNDPFEMAKNQRFCAFWQPWMVQGEANKQVDQLMPQVMKWATDAGITEQVTKTLAESGSVDLGALMGGMGGTAAPAPAGR